MLYKYNKNNVMDKLMNTLSAESYKRDDKFRSLISEFLNDEDYFLSYLDIYIISKKFDLPIILLCNSVINNVISKEKYIMLNKNPENNLYYFIKIPSQYLRGQKNYKLLHFENSIMIDIDKDLNNSAEYEFENKILERVKNFEDLIFYLKNL